MAEEEQPQQHGRDVKLPTFWKARPEWFVYGEIKFRLKNVDDEQEQSDHLLAALSEEVLAQAMDVMEYLPEDMPYSTLKEQLLETHTLSNFEKLELLFKTGQLGARKPSQLLNSMLEYCPQGKERGVFFHFMFLQQLPQSLRILLGEVEHGDPRALAARADMLWACHGKQIQQGIAVVETEEKAESVAAIRGQGSSGRTRKRRRAASRRRAANRRLSYDDYGVYILLRMAIVVARVFGGINL
jgi:hypothetical protein